MIGKALVSLLAANTIGQGDVYSVSLDALEDINRLKSSLHVDANTVPLNHFFQEPTPSTIKPKLFVERVLGSDGPAITPESLAPNLFERVWVRHQNIAVDERHAARAIPKVSEGDVHDVCICVDLCHIGIDVTSYLRFADISGDRDGILGGARGDAGFGKRPPHKIDPKAGKADASDTDRGHKHGPESHRFLRVKIALGAAMVLSGYYFYSYAFTKGRKVCVEAGLPYAILGIFNVLAGTVLAAHSYFSYMR